MRVARAAGLRERGDGGVPPRPRRVVLLPRGQHPAAGRARGHRTGRGPGHRPRAVPPRGRPAAVGCGAGGRCSGYATPASHAIEVRIERGGSGRDFAPTPGRLTALGHAGRAGRPRRYRARVLAIEVPAEYDNLIAKIMVHAGTRDDAIDRLRRALDETEIGGIQTTLPFHRFVARDPSFRAGDCPPEWVAEHWDGVVEFRRAAGLAMLAAGRRGIRCIERPRRRGAGPLSRSNEARAGHRPSGRMARRWSRGRR